MDSSGVCWRQQGSCSPLDSVVNYLYPYVQDASASNATLHFDLLGYGDAAARAGIECGPALTDGELAGILHWLTDDDRESGFFSNGHNTPGAKAGDVSESLPQARYLRSKLYLSLSRWNAIRSTQKVLQLTDRLEAAATNPYVRVYCDIMEREWMIRDVKLNRWLWHDGILLLIAVCLIWAYMWFFFGSALFALLAVMQIVLSFPLMFFVVAIMLNQRPISAFACTALWVVTGVSADNIFVVHETWQQSRLLVVKGEPAPLERRVRSLLGPCSWRTLRQHLRFS
jgi:hypothetical protein